MGTMSWRLDDSGIIMMVSSHPPGSTEYTRGITYKKL